MFEELAFLPKVRRAEYAHREKVEEVIDFLDLQPYRDQYIANLPLRRTQSRRTRARPVHPAETAAARRAGLRSQRRGNGKCRFWIDDIKNDLGIAVLMVEHDMSLVTEVSDRVMAMNDGKAIAEGTSDEVQSHPDVLRAYLGA